MTDERPDFIRIQDLDTHYFDAVEVVVCDGMLEHVVIVDVCLSRQRDGFGVPTDWAISLNAIRDGMIDTGVDNEADWLRPAEESELQGLLNDARMAVLGDRELVFTECERRYQLLGESVAMKGGGRVKESS